MTGFASDEIQIAIYDALKADGLGVSERIYDQAPEKAVYPYVTFGSSSGMDNSNKSKDGSDNVFLINVWSEEGGMMQVKGIMKTIQGVLNHANLSITDQTLIDIRNEFYDITRLQDEDGFYYRGSLRYRVLTQEA